MANRRNFVRAVKVAIIRRATRPDGQPACERCGAIGCKLEIHHIDMDAMVLDEDKGRKLTADEGELLCEPCHDPITAAQRKVLKKAQKTEASHVGAVRPAGTIPSRPRPERPAKDRTVTKVANGVSELSRRFSR